MKELAVVVKKRLVFYHYRQDAPFRHNALCFMKIPFSRLLFCYHKNIIIVYDNPLLDPIPENVIVGTRLKHPVLKAPPMC
jgi:hypothetical protein